MNERLDGSGSGVVVENEYAYIADMPPPPPSPSPPPPAPPPLSAPPFPPPPPLSPAVAAHVTSSLGRPHGGGGVRPFKSAAASAADDTHTAFPFPPPPPPEQLLANGKSSLAAPISPRHEWCVSSSHGDTIKQKSSSPRVGTIRVKDVAPYSIRTCNGLQHQDVTVAYRKRSELPTYYELEPDAMPSDAVPYEYGYSCQTGQKFTVYHSKSIGKNTKVVGGGGVGGGGGCVAVGKKKQKTDKKKTGTM